jgi:hypothetical protein
VARCIGGSFSDGAGPGVGGLLRSTFVAVVVYVGSGVTVST